MQEEAKTPEGISPDVQEAMRNLVAAIRAVKLYPSNNPIYSQSVKKSYESLSRFLETTPEYPVGVQKTNFTYAEMPVGKDTQVNKPIAQDLFAKGMREIIFSQGLTEAELLTLLQSLALSSEQLGIKSGISSILWETDSKHIKVVEAGLEDVISMQTVGELEAEEQKRLTQTAAKKILPAGHTLVLSDLMADPEAFGAQLLEIAKQTRAKHESVEDKLFTLYQEAGRKIKEKHPDKSDEMFEKLAQSALSLEPSVRNGLIGGKLYGDFDSETAQEQKGKLEEHLPNEFQEILTGRFSNVWNLQQVTALLKKSSATKIDSAAPPSPQSLPATPVPPDMADIARQMGEYTPEEMAALKAMGEMGLETDIVEAAVRTLIFLLSQVKNPHHPVSEEEEVKMFSGVVHQLEELLRYLLLQKDYALAGLIIKAFHLPVAPSFKPRLDEALNRTVSKSAIAETVAALRSYQKGTSEYASAHTYLAIFENEATEVLMELLAEEGDRSARLFLLDLVKEIGKDQVTLFGKYVTDPRWYVVRNVVCILGETKSEQALVHLNKAAGHKDLRIRQEVVKALIAIGGKKAAGVLAKFLEDKEEELQEMGIRGFADITNIGNEEARYLSTFLEDRPIKKKEHTLSLEAIRALGKIGSREAGEFLKRYDRIRWWKSRKLQKELRAAAQQAMAEIKRRQGDGGRSGR
jgi:hypothetical protein